MARHFEFTDKVRNDAFFRQNARCAVCRYSLKDQEEFGHHVIPDQSGDPEDKQDAFLRSVDNCVMLCHTCHYVVHDSGHYRVGSVPPPDYYAHTHPRKAAQQAWEALIRREYLRIYGKKFGRGPGPGAPSS